MIFDKTILAAWQQLASPQVTISMASLGFDWIVVDLEHSCITTQETEAIFIAAERHNAMPFVRLPSADPYLARRLLDAGAAGILVPVVETREKFDDFAQHCFYPPKGRRGLGLMRANSWGADLKEYFNDFKPVMIAQIENRLGASNIDEILASPFLDGIMIGPYDMTANLHKPGQFEDAEFKTICKDVHAAARKSRKFIGYHQVQPDLTELKKRIDEKYDFIAYGTDLVAIRSALSGATR
jgi:2-dehydro-3-deoxyglucarate aldolase